MRLKMRALESQNIQRVPVVACKMMPLHISERSHRNMPSQPHTGLPDGLWNRLKAAKKRNSSANSCRMNGKMFN